jgi:hypothetical protein
MAQPKPFHSGGVRKLVVIEPNALKIMVIT